MAMAGETNGTWTAACFRPCKVDVVKPASLDSTILANRARCLLKAILLAKYSCLRGFALANVVVKCSVIKEE
eukprot:scaffold2987_cov170-Amphora_coffeaeformis.AAC.16